jgi:hypothetical protein
MRYSLVLDCRVVAEGSEEAVRAASRLIHGEVVARHVHTADCGWLCEGDPVRRYLWDTTDRPGR